MIGRVALLVTFKKAKPKPQSLSRSHIRDLAPIMKAILVVVTLFVSTHLGAQVNFNKLTLLETSDKVSQLYQVLDIPDTNAIIFDFGYYHLPKHPKQVQRKFIVFYGDGLVQHITHQVLVRKNNKLKIKLKKRNFEEIQATQLCAHLDSCILNGAFLLNSEMLESMDKYLPDGGMLTLSVSHGGGPNRLWIIQGSHYTSYWPPPSLDTLILGRYIGYRVKQRFLNMYQFLYNHI